MKKDGRYSPPVLRAADFPAGGPCGADVAGLDEAGRGPLAGPVYAACVVLPEGFPLGLLGDSKALSEKRRYEAFQAIVHCSSVWAIDWATPAEIDELNILEASLLAMRRSYMSCVAILGRRPASVFVDGNRDPGLVHGGRRRRGVTLVIKGDSIVPAVMAASILAKVARDRMMERWDWLCPGYGYSRHKGYPTKAHRAAIRLLGPSAIQRMTFRVKED